MSVRGLTIRENLVSRVAPQYFAFRNTFAVVVVQSFVDMEAPGVGRTACVHTTGRTRAWGAPQSDVESVRVSRERNPSINSIN